MNNSINSPLGVCVLAPPSNNMVRTVSYPQYIHDILQHAGIAYTHIPVEELPGHLENFSILLTVGDMVPDENLRGRFQSWLENGGAWIAIGGTAGVPELFGVELEPVSYSTWGGGSNTLGEGYLQPSEQSHPVVSHIEIPLHFFNGLPVKPSRAKVRAVVLDAHQRPTERAAVTESTVGKGRCLLVAVDVMGSVVRIQQGVSVTRDGVPAPDGTAPICDNVLKSGDGGVLDWLFDRQPVDGVPGYSAFLQPVADQWRELILRAVLYLAEEYEVPVPLLWYYPRCLPAIGHLSHDTDGNDEELGRLMLQTVKKAGIYSTWCVLPPGYGSELIGDISNAGHELAVHYDSMTEGTVWSEEEFDSQWWYLKQLFGEDIPVSNKNHYLRWEGDTEFFNWCSKRGIKLDESKGASKSGEAGFNFGACHPYYPAAPDGTILDVLELATPTQDLVVFAPPALADQLLKAVRKHHGILHLLFHPAHIGKPGVEEALLGIVKKARECGLEWWTARQISAWENARRQIRWSDYQSDGNACSIRLTLSDALPGAAVLWLNTQGGLKVKVAGEEEKSQKVRFMGFQFSAVIIEGRQNSEYTFEITKINNQEGVG